MTDTEEQYKNNFINFLYYLAIHDAGLTSEQKLIQVADFVFYNVDNVTKYTLESQDTYFGNKVGVVYDLISKEIPTARKNLEESKDVKCWDCLDYLATKNQVGQEDMLFCICKEEQDEKDVHE